MKNKVPKNEYHNKKGYAPKKNPEKIVNDGVIYDPRGQWDFPGEVTKIPSGNITMQGVPYPVLGVDDLGNEQMMYPGFDYIFPGNTVTEYPQLQYGGDPSIPELDQAKKGGWLSKYSKMPKKKSSKNIKSSINKLMTKNPLFERNSTLYGAKGPRLYDPTSKYQTGGQVVSEIWQEVTGTPWKRAKELGLTDGSYDANIALRKRLLDGEFDNVNVSQQKTYENKKEQIQKKQEVAKKKIISPKSYSSQEEYEAHLLDPWSPEKQAAQLDWIKKSKNTTPKKLPEKSSAKKAANVKQSPVNKPPIAQQKTLAWDPNVFGNKKLSGKDIREIPQSGVVVDKRTNQLYYFGDNASGTAPIITGKNPDLNYNPYPVEYLFDNPDVRNTPRGYYIMETPPIYQPDIKEWDLINDKGETVGNYYDYLTNTYAGKYRPITPIPAYGQPAPVAQSLGLHRTASGNASDPNDPEFVRRSKLYNKDPNLRCTSYGCVNTQDATYDEIYKAFPTADTLLVLDSRLPEDARILQIAKNRINQKKQGGSFNQYQGGGITINSEEEYRKSLLMKNKTKERMDAERAWAAKKVAATNQAKTQQPSGIPSPQQQAALFGMKPIAAESTGIAAKPVYTPKEKQDIQKAQYDAKREKARQVVRATYGPQGSNPRALYDEEGLINSYLGAQERQQKKEQEMKTLGSGLLLGAVAAPVALEAIGSGIAAAPSYISAAGTAYNAPIAGAVGSSAAPWLTPKLVLGASGFYTGATGLKDETAPLLQKAYQNPSMENIANVSMSALGNALAVSPALGRFTDKPFTNFISAASPLASLEMQGLKKAEEFAIKKLASQTKKSTQGALREGFAEDEGEPSYYPATPRRGLYSDDPYYNTPAESTGVYPRYYAQNLIAAPESTGVNPQYNWLDYYR
jgi:hypothetical protein